MILLLGEAPNQATVDYPNLWLVPDDSGIAHTANRLRDLAGWTTRDFLRVFSRRDNVSRVPVETWTRNVKIACGDRAYNAIHAAAQHGIRTAVCVGRHATEAALAHSQPTRVLAPFEWADVGPISGGPFSVAYLPHTSGRNRFWNQPGAEEAGRAFLLAVRSIAGVELPTSIGPGEPFCPRPDPNGTRLEDL